VRATVRNMEEKKVRHLRDCDATGRRLQLFVARLDQDGAFDWPCVGCEFVIHAASPDASAERLSDREMVHLAVKGTLSLLQSCVRSRSVHKVVITSSVAALIDTPKDGEVCTEEPDRNSRSTLRKNAYYFSKTEAEKAAWLFVKGMKEESPFSLVAINPTVVIGPSLSTPESATRPNCSSNGIIVDLLTQKRHAIIHFAWG